VRAELPVPPQPKGFGWAGIVGPGVIVLGVSIGGGEFLLGPAAFVRHGSSLHWVTVVSVFFQTVFNTVDALHGGNRRAGVQRLHAHAAIIYWTWFYSLLYFLQTEWPASAGVAAGAIFFLLTRLLPRAIRPPVWRRAALAGMALFYGFFVILSLRSFW
jgi:hypothetical protein